MKGRVHLEFFVLLCVTTFVSFNSAKPPTLESRMMLIEKRLGELETENAEKKDTITVLDSTNKNLEFNIKDKEGTVNILSEEIESLKGKIR